MNKRKTGKVYSREDLVNIKKQSTLGVNFLPMKLPTCYCYYYYDVRRKTDFLFVFVVILRKGQTFGKCISAFHRNTAEFSGYAENTIVLAGAQHLVKI